jgi:hypothetical protein
MQTPPSTETSFFVPLEVRDWVVALRSRKHYFRCRALGLPGAKVVGLTAGGETTVPKDSYLVKGSRVYWTAGAPPNDLFVELRLRHRLLSLRETILSVILALLLGVSFARQTAWIDRVAETTEQVGALVTSLIPSSLAAPAPSHAEPDPMAEISAQP